MASGVAVSSFDIFQSLCWFSIFKSIAVIWGKRVCFSPMSHGLNSLVSYLLTPLVVSDGGALRDLPKVPLPMQTLVLNDALKKAFWMLDHLCPILVKSKLILISKRKYKIVQYYNNCVNVSKCQIGSYSNQ